MTTWRKRFACRIPKAANTHPEYVTRRFSTATMAPRTSYLHCALGLLIVCVSGDPQCDHSLRIPEHATTPLLRNSRVYLLKTEYQGMVERGASHHEHTVQNTVMRRITTGIRSEKCVVRRFRRCANVIECTYTNLDSIAHYTPRLYGIAYCS